MPESQLGSVRMRPSQIQIEDDQQVSTQRRNFLSPTFSQNLPLFRELQSRQAQNREPDYSNSILTLTDEKVISCHAQMIKSLMFNLFLQAFFVNYFTYMHWKYSHRYVLLQLWIQDLITIFILIYYNYRKGDDCIWQLIETMFLFFFKIFIVFYYEVQAFKIYFIAIMMLAVSSLLLIMKLVQKIKTPTKTSTALILQFLKTMCCLQLLLITLKWESKISWSWIQIFLLLWVFLVVCALLLFISLVSCIETLVNIIKKKQQCHYCKYNLQSLVAGNLWIFIMLIGFTLFPFLFILRTAEFYEENQLITITETAKYIVVITLFSLFLLIFTLCFYKQIKQGSLLLMIRAYLKDVQGISDQNDVDQQQTVQSPNSRQLNSPHQPKKLEFVKLGIPLYLIKLSCTYFAVLDKASFEFKKKRQKSHPELESGRSNLHGSTMKETWKKILQKPVASNSMIIHKKQDDVDLEIQKPAITDNVKVKREETPVTVSKQEQEEEPVRSIKSIKSDGESSVNQEKCLVCYENTPNIVFVPCRHGGICQQCAEDVIQKSNECYLCRKTISQILKVQKNVNKQLEVKEASILS
ncbi:unnamed protein product (macronuclear) [Paramecium tetraurelia]|uniref:RING-type domain-containing protein n=1 Tax=Paramecium tetraurelia TaxID=5888 RepID=A0BMU2_PARTE|nr:uncharacterized protein GSPATT00030495001 [Paramecium tetraurelia]CAK59859.1 unnamed protein product [Paramecium tetraurelia]|eukprot:XP_001427257.1 hypothetical protein (macronuclear) [Paramecium tetraurelia strain d4-2]